MNPRHRPRRKPPALSLFLLAVLWSTLVQANHPPPFVLPLKEQAPLGRHASLLVEEDEPLDLSDAIAAHTAGRFRPAGHAYISLGIGARPAWLRLEARNPGDAPLRQRLSIETAWLDRIDVYFIHQDRLQAHWQAGDTLPFDQRPVDSRFFQYDHDFAPGNTVIYLRVATPDPMVIPVYLTGIEQARARERFDDYSYGFLYGSLAALLAYNLALFFSLRSFRYLFYALYLGTFLAMNIAYTGHGYQWLWPESPRWQQWANPVLITAFSLTGLLFAMRFLETRRTCPWLHRLVKYGLIVFTGLELLMVLAGNQVGALLVAFTLVFTFSIGMITLGGLSLYRGNGSARYFLIASVTHASTASVTAMVVWGLIPFSLLAYRAVDIGMMIDAILLAMALAEQFRVNQQQKTRAEELANRDPLTGLYNRRAFHNFVDPQWHHGLRHHHEMSVILLDIDHFKVINDTHGHAEGDRVLVAISDILRREIRHGDVLARWGGEEFILFLPETGLDQATTIAERLRQEIGRHRQESRGAWITQTVSLGVASNRAGDDVEALITRADLRLYAAKAMGRNRVCNSTPANDGADPSLIA